MYDSSFFKVLQTHFSRMPAEAPNDDVSVCPVSIWTKHRKTSSCYDRSMSCPSHCPWGRLRRSTRSTRSTWHGADGPAGGCSSYDGSPDLASRTTVEPRRGSAESSGQALRNGFVKKRLAWKTTGKPRENHRKMEIYIDLPSGKCLHNYGTSPFLNGEIHYKYQCSIAMSNFRRVISKRNWLTELSAGK